MLDSRRAGHVWRDGSRDGRWRCLPASLTSLMSIVSCLCLHRMLLMQGCTAFSLRLLTRAQLPQDGCSTGNPGAVGRTACTDPDREHPRIGIDVGLPINRYKGIALTFGVASFWTAEGTKKFTSCSATRSELWAIEIIIPSAVHTSLQAVAGRPHCLIRMSPLCRPELELYCRWRRCLLAVVAAGLHASTGPCNSFPLPCASLQEPTSPARDTCSCSNIRSNNSCASRLLQGAAQQWTLASYIGNIQQHYGD